MNQNFVQTQKRTLLNKQKSYNPEFKKCFNQYCKVLSTFMQEAKSVNYNSTIQKSSDKTKLYGTL